MGAKKKVKVGLIGAGGISQVAHIPNLLANKDAKLTALCDVAQSRVALVSQRFGIPKWYDVPEQMFESEKLDCVVITTPTITHLPLCRLALECGVDVMVEKPFARSVAEAEEITSIAEGQERILMVAMNHRFRDDTSHLKELVEAGEFGDIISIRSGWLKRLGVWGRPYWFTDPKLAGGGVMMDLGLQMIDIILYLLNFPTMLEVVGTTSHAMLDLEVEDSATAFMRLEDNVSFQLEVAWGNCFPKDIAYTVLSGSRGIAEMNPLRIARRQRDRVIEMTPPKVGDEINIYHRSFQTEVAYFIDCVGKQEQPISTGREAVRVLDAIERIYRSSGG